MQITIPDALAERLTMYACNRNTTPEKIAVRYIRESLPPHIAETAVCSCCGKEFKPHNRKLLFCSWACFQSMPFPRQHPGMTVEDLARTCRTYHTQKRAAEAVGVSYSRFQKVVKKFDLAHHFPLKHGEASWAEGRTE